MNLKFFLVFVVIMSAGNCFSKEDLRGFAKRAKQELKTSEEAHGKVKKLGEYFAKNENMKFLNSGSGLILGSKRIAFEINLMSNQCLED